MAGLWLARGCGLTKLWRVWRSRSERAGHYSVARVPAFNSPRILFIVFLPIANSSRNGNSIVIEISKCRALELGPRCCSRASNFASSRIIYLTRQQWRCALHRRTSIGLLCNAYRRGPIQGRLIISLTLRRVTGVKVTEWGIKRAKIVDVVFSCSSLFNGGMKSG